MNFNVDFLAQLHWLLHKEHHHIILRSSLGHSCDRQAVSISCMGRTAQFHRVLNKAAR